MCLEGSNLKMFKNNETSELPTPCTEPGRVGVLSDDFQPTMQGAANAELRAFLLGGILHGDQPGYSS